MPRAEYLGTDGILSFNAKHSAATRLIDRAAGASRGLDFTRFTCCIGPFVKGDP